MLFPRFVRGRGFGLLCLTPLLACGDDVATEPQPLDAGPELDAGEFSRAAARPGGDAAVDATLDATTRTSAQERAADGGTRASQSQERDAGEQAPMDPVDAASQPSARSDAGAAASRDAAPEVMTQKVSLRFQARVGKSELACGQKYPSQGVANTTVTPSDLRLFVHEVQLMRADGERVPLHMSERPPWQSESLALLDFADSTGRCTDGSTETNTTVSGTVPSGNYTGVSFIVGVPAEQNHLEPSELQEPLKSVVGLGAGGVEGFRFASLGVVQLSADGAAQGGAHFELGSTQCERDDNDRVSCGKPNRAQITLEPFNLETSSVVIDASVLWSQLDLTQAHECHATEKSCEPLFRAFGLELATGGSTSSHSLFRVE